MCAPGKWGQVTHSMVLFLYEASSSLPRSQLSSPVSFIYVFILFGDEKYGKEKIFLAKEAYLSSQMYRKEDGTTQTERTFCLCKSIGFWHFFLYFLQQQGDLMVRLFCLDACFWGKHQDRVFYFLVTLKPFVVGCGQQKVASWFCWYFLRVYVII